MIDKDKEDIEYIEDFNRLHDLMESQNIEILNAPIQFRSYFVLSYIIEPTRIIYFVSNVNGKIWCSPDLNIAHKYDNIEIVRELQKVIKMRYQLDFEIKEI